MMKNSNSRKPNKTVFIVACIALVMAIGTIAVFAYLSGKSGPVTNTLNADTDPSPVITETFNGTVKEDVAVSVGKTDYTVYVRAAIVVNWVDGQGNIYSQAPVENTDYELNVLLDTAVDATKKSHWHYCSSDGFYYFSQPVSSNGTTDILIDSASVLSGANVPSGYTLSVEIAAQMIQAIGTTDADDTKLAVVDAWGVTVATDGTITKN